MAFLKGKYITLTGSGNRIYLVVGSKRCVVTLHRGP